MKFATIALSSAGVLAAYVAYKVNMFSKATSTITSTKDMRVVYKVVVGSYRQTWKEARNIEKAVLAKKGIHLEKSPCVNIYYDNPSTTAPEKCRAFIGKIIPEGVTIEPFDDIRVGTINAMKEAVRVVHPTNSPTSYMFAVPRCYKELFNVIKSKNVEVKNPPIEVYGEEDNSLVIYYSFNKEGGLLEVDPK